MGLRSYIANRRCHQTLQDGGRLKRLYLADQRYMGLWCDWSIQLQARPSRQSIYRNCCLYWLIRSGGRWRSQECHTRHSARLYAASRHRVVPPHTPDGTLYDSTTRLPYGRPCHRCSHRRKTEEKGIGAVYSYTTNRRMPHEHPPIYSFGYQNYATETGMPVSAVMRAAMADNSSRSILTSECSGVCRSME